MPESLPRTVLVVEDEPLLQTTLRDLLTDEGFTPVLAGSRAEAAAALHAGAAPTVTLLDLKLPDGSGLDLLRREHDARRLGRGEALGAVIVLTAFGDSAHSIEAMRLGAFDYLTKPFDVDDLLAHVHRAYRHRAETEAARREAPPAPALDVPMVGESAAMREVYKTIGRAAPSDVPVLITGESGTGKELVARALHVHSLRAVGPFVPVNCAAIPDELIESELFGYEKGAFTGAESRRVGLFERADKGTLFLDEVGDLGSAVQAKLLRVLQEGAFFRVGGRDAVTVDVRVVAATHRDLEAMVREGAFREDLYFRLNVLRLRLPALRERGDDVLALARHLVRKHGGPAHPGLSEATEAALVAHDWPGNVRELENALRHALLMAGPGVVLPEHLPERPRGGGAATAPEVGPGFSLAAHLEAVERSAIAEAMRQAGGVRTRAAELLGIHRRLLYEKLKRYGLDEA